MKDMKRVNTVAVLKGTVSVVRAPVMSCLTILRGVVVGAFKLPGGARRTGESKDLLQRKVYPTQATKSGERSFGRPTFNSCWSGDYRTFERGMIFDRI